MQYFRKNRLDKVLVPFQLFFSAEASGGILLLGVTMVALALANSPWQEWYRSIWQSKFTLGFDSFQLSKPVILWVNDALMAIFFFVVGLEIKREVLVGELASFRKAVFPIVAAIGGMVFPAAFYFFLNPDAPGVSGWGVPMATDIAFALGVLALLGDKVPITAKVFLTAFAIIDDIGAALVIAFFYTSEISTVLLYVAGSCCVGMMALNWMGFRHIFPYSLLGFCMWVAFLKSGVHPTLSGILAAFAIPARTKIDASSFLNACRSLLDEFDRAGSTGKSVLTNKEQNGALHSLEVACEYVQTPLQQLEHLLHPWVVFLIMPIFALANAGVSIGSESSAVLSNSVFWGVVLGLVVGKPLGIVGLCWVIVKLGVAERPSGIQWKQLLGLGFLGGIGFTMSLFIANLAFRGEAILTISKLGVLAASIVSGVIGFVLLRSSFKTGSVSED